MLGESPGDKFGLSLRSETRKPNQHNTRVDQTSTKNEFAKVLIRREQERVSFTAFVEHGSIIDSGIQFSYELNAMPIGAKAFNDLPIHALVRNNVQLTFSKG